MDSKQPQPDGAAPPDAVAANSAGRRRFVRGGLASAPVLLSVVSRPASATVACKAASAFSSANLSRPGNGAGTCSGKGPIDWKGQGTWPVVKTTLFTDIGPHGFAAGITLDGVLGLSDSTNAKIIAKLVVAAYLNAKATNLISPTTILDVGTVKNIWASYYSSTFYAPTAGVKWYFDYAVPTASTGGLKQWLQTTMTTA